MIQMIQKNVHCNNNGKKRNVQDPGRPWTDARLARQEFHPALQDIN